MTEAELSDYLAVLLGLAAEGCYIEASDKMPPPNLSSILESRLPIEFTAASFAQTLLNVSNFDSNQSSGSHTSECRAANTSSMSERAREESGRFLEGSSADDGFNGSGGITADNSCICSGGSFLEGLRSESRGEEAEIDERVSSAVRPKLTFRDVNHTHLTRSLQTE
ncbi:unnamed protein product [Protopolystoma xenopodis]|uniref:Uncharacterized protein n=1 Tax=Protopolystoma xenopodis TaxID=117903 RepID=A0A3S5AE69_9PLAT|nr:unnamed protein product [Protopolystoma xenopodis]